MLTSIIQRLRRLIRDESGPTAVEYAVMLALIIVVCLVSIRLIGEGADGTFKETADAIRNSGKIDGNQDGNGQW